MKMATCNAIVLASALVLMSSTAIAAEYSGSWQVLQNHNRRSSRACEALGLTRYQAVCQPGQRYATYCEDARGGRYRIRQTDIVCSPDHREGNRNGGFRDNSENSRDDRWDLRDNRRDAYRDHRDGNRDDRRNQVQDCTQWDNTANRPCAPGTINRDCRNSCDGR